MATRIYSSSFTRLAWSSIRVAARMPLRQTNSPTKVYSPVSRRCFTTARSALAKKFSEDHEWIELDSDGTTGTIGISTYAANALGEVVYVELPQIDVEFAAGDQIGAVESVKSASDIFTPVTGTIIEANSELESTPAMINKNPEGDGWIAKIKVENTSELDNLMDAEGYKKFTESDEVQQGDH